MEIEKLKSRIKGNEEWLLQTSTSINDAFNEHRIKTIVAFIDYIIRENKTEVLDAFDIQSEERICQALLTLLSQDSSYHEPLQKMLIYRVLTYAHSASDLKNYIEESETLQKITENLLPLLNLTKAYSEEYLEGLTIDKVLKSLKSDGLAKYIVHFKETDIQIVLKAIRSDKGKVQSGDKLGELLDFLYDRLQSNNKVQCIEASRHAWWAYKDLITLQSAEWVLHNKIALLSFLDNLIERDVYTPHKKLMPTSGILDTTTVYYERVWVVENAIQILDRAKNLNDCFDAAMVQKLRKYIISLIELHITAESRVNHLRNIQCDLVLSYYVLKNYELIFSEPQPVAEQAVLRVNLEPNMINEIFNNRGE